MGRSCVKRTGPEFGHGVSRHSKDPTGRGKKKKKPPRAEVAQLLGDPVVRGKPFLNSVEKAYTSGTSVITEATRPVCQAGLMWSPDQVLFLAPVALRSPCTPRSYRSEHMPAPCTADSPLSVLRCVRTAASNGTASENWTTALPSPTLGSLKNLFLHFPRRLRIFLPNTPQARP